MLAMSHAAAGQPGRRVTLGQGVWEGVIPSRATITYIGFGLFFECLRDFDNIILGNIPLLIMDITTRPFNFQHAKVCPNMSSRLAKARPNVARIISSEGISLVRMCVCVRPLASHGLSDEFLI